MHQYKIEIFLYTPEGAVGNLVTTRYADNPEHARSICAEYENQYQVNELGEKTGHKMYKVNLHILGYRLCHDRAAFFANFNF